MNILENLENLNVSEECFNDIMGIVEDLLSEGYNLQQMVDRAYDKGKVSPRKHGELRDKALRVPSSNDFHVNDKGKCDFSNHTGKCTTKNDMGEFDTDSRHEKSGRNKKELIAKRYNDEKNGYLQARAKAERKHKKQENK